MKLLPVLLFVVWMYWACGRDDSPPARKPVSPPPPIPTDKWTATIKPIMQENCGLSGCHANAPFVKTEAGFLASNAAKRIANGSMPPSYSPRFGQWSEDDKQTVLAFYDSARQ